MIKYFFLIIFIFLSSSQAYQNSSKKNCPVPFKDLKLLSIKHLGYDGKDKIGELLVHKDISSNVEKIFKELYEIKYPIYQMKLVSNYNNDDWKSIEANNTSAYNCRVVAGTKKWSNHSYGKAIDINPIENPYISRKGYISHKESLKYRKRVHKENTLKDRAILLKDDEAVKIFKKYGWSWGGDWITIKDYQHFEYKRKGK
ncbi:M15 family metallopeptidase [Arcobacter peruensis]|uniref:M15 family metallopeptidase n=1 Tax=Arcobacter peruensis TaxID=2320140 RepID=UPI000F0766EB|nr:M15 family metallopeptidase [Arcobacter peruensis]